MSVMNYLPEKGVFSIVSQLFTSSTKADGRREIGVQAVSAWVCNCLWMSQCVDCAATSVANGEEGTIQGLAFH